MKASCTGYLGVVMSVIEAGANVNQTNNVSTCKCILLLYSNQCTLCIALCSAGMCTVGIYMYM